ncbi:hypothetical protein Q0590_32485 [Rhodocytophaga aerolata]|uniref:Tetratricopeptide repeat protein n=1 Tax=Rhodocytophaga aerolata TaxID=455078 RepID=A0ABT8RG02_9BACT|nr:hypothetical protein [Rhodocytophaga aerolata]MDO1451037.1 hypothetical protein [Rhodocytophaga aerolata]
MLQLFLLSLLGSFSFAAFLNPGIDIHTLRREYLQAVENEDKTNELLAVLTKENSQEPLRIGYKGALEALKAKHAFNPYNKLSYLKKAQQTFEQAISLSPEDVELRFLRFSVQHYLPSFLGASKNLEEDKLVIVKNIAQPGLDKDVQATVARFLLETKRCTATEQQKLQAVLN